MERIGRLSTTTPDHTSSGIGKLLEACPERDGEDPERCLSSTPITCGELEVLLALCNAGPLLSNQDQASQLLDQLSLYLFESHVQTFAPSPFLRAFEPSPWEALTYHLTKTVLAIGLRHDDLHDVVLECTERYLQSCLQTVNQSLRRQSTEASDQAEVEGSLDIAAVSVSLLGFLEAASQYTDFYTSSEKLDLIRLLRQLFDENLMVSIEGVFSSLRTSETTHRIPAEWRMHTKRYAASGRPLGAMLLQQSFMKFLVSCSSLQICSAEQLRKTDVFDSLIAAQEAPSNGYHESNTALIEAMTELAAESMRLLEDGSDYLQLGSAWQQRLAFSVKACSLHTYLNCMVVDEEIADVDILMSWLEDSMGDPVQMADDTLAAIVLKSVAVIAKLSPSIASTLSRSLPRFIVQGGIRGDTVVVAARSLTYILRQLSQDAVITGLYSLGNVLSTGSGTDRIVRGIDLVNGPTKLPKIAGQTSHISTQHSTGSAISLDMSGEEETSAAYGTVVRAVVSIAMNCRDDKITSLAQSMLLQKLGRISLAVDLNIIREAAVLAMAGGETDFRSLLKLYHRLCHDGVKSKDGTLLTAVSHCFTSELNPADSSI